MTLETEVGRMATALERLAAVFENAYSKHNSETANPEPLVVKPEDEAVVAKMPKRRGRPANTDTVVKEPEAKPVETTKTELTIADVRAALTELQGRTNATTAKGVLQQFNATTLSGLPVEKYAEVIKAAKAA